MVWTPTGGGGAPLQPVSPEQEKRTRQYQVVLLMEEQVGGVCNRHVLSNNPNLENPQSTSTRQKQDFIQNITTVR